MPAPHLAILYPPSQQINAEARKIFAGLKKDAIYRCLFSADGRPKVVANKLSGKDTKKVEAALGPILEINSKAPSGRTVGLTVVDGNVLHEFQGACGRLNGMMVLSHAPVIFSTLEMLTSGAAPTRVILTHEAAHVYFSKMSIEEAKPVLNAYEAIMKTTGLLPWPNQLDYVLFGTGVYADYTSVFSEETYAKGAGGHPYAGEHELFSSLTAIAKYFPAQFFREVAAFANEGDKGITLDAFGAVVRAWGNAKLFANEVYQKLGLSIPVEKKSLLLKERRNI